LSENTRKKKRLSWDLKFDFENFHKNFRTDSKQNILLFTQDTLSFPH
jgi:hypothetical protein